MVDKSKSTKIYRLFWKKQPNITRYIGKTCKSLNERLAIHRYSAKKAKIIGKNLHSYNWMNSINLEIGIELLETIKDWEKGELREIQLIQEYRDRGEPLTNTTRGGDGRKFGIRSNNPKTSKVLQYDLQGDFIKEWQSVTDASLFYNTTISKISDCKNKGKSSIGFQWKNYINNYPLKINKYSSKIGETNKEKEGWKIKQLDLDNNLLNTFNTLHEAEKLLKIPRQSITYSIKHNTIYRNKYCFIKV